MSLGPIMLDVAGVELTEEDKDILRHPLVGGVILFTRNFASMEQLQDLVKAIHALRDPRLLIAVDHEGGRVQRFREGFSLIPPMARFGEIYHHDHKKARSLSNLCGWLMAVELRAVDIDFSFAPVLDLDYGISTVIGDRAFERDPAIVTELAHEFMKGMQDAGMAATGKHFPGHGAIAADSHIDIPVDERSYNEIYAEDIQPFKRMIEHNLAAIMPAHVIYNQVDPMPAGFSGFWLQDVLRKRLNFQGVIFSDDLDMQGASVISDDYTERARAALTAGCDMALVCNNRPAAIQVLEGLGEYDDPVGHMRLARMHGRHPTSWEKLRKNVRWRSATDILKQYQENPTLDLDFKLTE
ncbi:MAG: beta-N-acetylhexosaminidase [Gammaproteobacteria bacterium]|nr:beta-N-acetylhexosaminidase [Gammaproteobacteria bacterium]MDH5652618.1 beta-N-acetylhexosaminidase [Gammaproteobacteria bacterium]